MMLVNCCSVELDEKYLRLPSFFVSLLQPRVVLLLLTSTVWILVGGAGMLGNPIGLNAVSAHGACTAIFVAIAAVVGASLASIQTLGKITWLAWVGVTCILIASEL